MKRSTISMIATLGLSIGLLSGCSQPAPEATPVPQPPPPAVTPVPPPPEPSPAPVEPSPAEVVKPAEPAKPAQPAGAKTANALRENGDEARSLIREIRGLTADLRKLSDQIEANTDGIYNQAQQGAVQATDKLIEDFKGKSQELNNKVNLLKSVLKKMDGEVAKLR